MLKKTRLILALIVIATSAAAAQTDAAATVAEKPLARYMIQQGPEDQSLPALPGPCNSELRASDEMARYRCETCDAAEAVAGLGGGRTLRNPPLLLEHAFARIAAGEMTGSHERIENGIRHYVAWAAADDRNALVVETLWR